MGQWPQVTTAEPAKMAAALILQMSDVARQVCMTSEKGRIMNDDGVHQITRFARDRLAADAVDAIYQDVVRLTRYERAGQTTDVLSLEFDALRHKAGTRMATEGGPSEEFGLILRIQSASSPKNEKSLVSASIRWYMDFAAGS